MFDSTLLALLFWSGLVLLAIAVFLMPFLVDRLNALLARLRRQGPALLGAEGLSSRQATVQTAFNVDPGGQEAKGRIFLRGELWSARCSVELASTLRPGDKVEVERIEGLVATLREKVDEAV